MGIVGESLHARDYFGLLPLKNAFEAEEAVEVSRVLRCVRVDESVERVNEY